MNDAPKPRLDWRPEVRAIAAEEAEPRRRGTGRGTGRPSILDYAARPEIDGLADPRVKAARAWRAEFIARLEAGDSDANVCAVMMLGTTTFYRWLADGEDRPKSEAEPRGHVGRSPYREFRDDVLRARPMSRSNHILVISRAASDGDWRASAWWLARRHPEEFSERHILENRHTGAGGKGPVVVANTGADLGTVLGVLPPDLADRVRAELAGIPDDLPPDPEDDRGAS